MVEFLSTKSSSWTWICPKSSNGLTRTLKAILKIPKGMFVWRDFR